MTTTSTHTCPECGQACANGTGLAAHRRHRHGVKGSGRRSPSPASRPAGGRRARRRDTDPQDAPPLASPRPSPELAVVPAGGPPSPAAHLPIGEETLDVLTAVAYLDDTPAPQVLAGALDEWKRARLEDPDVAKAVALRRRRREEITAA